MRNIFFYVARIIAFPFVWAIIFISYTFHSFINALLFVRYGGEWITYSKKGMATVQQIYKELVEQKEIPK